MKKNYLKIMLFALVLSLMPVTMFADADPATMILETKDGNTYTFLLEDNIFITYSDAEMLLNGDGVQTAFAIDNVYNFYFTGDLTGSAGIETVQVSADMAFRYVAPNVFEINGNSVVGVEVYDLSGHTVMRNKGNESVKVDLNSLSAGVYLVNAKMRNSTQTIKIVKK